MADTDLQADDPLAHASLVAHVGALLCEAFGAYGLLGVVVGGSAIELHAPDAYTSRDIDFVAETSFGSAVPIGQITEIMTKLGFRKGTARHWIYGSLFVETPPGPVEGEYDEIRVGPYLLRFMAKEVVVSGRIAEFYNTGNLPHAKQAILLLRVFADEWDAERLKKVLDRERLGATYQVLADLASGATEVTDETLTHAYWRLKGWALGGC